MSQPWECERSLSPERYARLVRRAAFDCYKWHTHADDRPALCPFPLVLEADAWERATALAELLAREALAAEQELLHRPELHTHLSLPAPLRQLLTGIANPTAGAARVMRFDFHWTADGWRISEGNIDAAGGFIEASGVTRLMADEHPHCTPAGDPAGQLSEAILRAVGAGGRVGLMHLTVYIEDHQVMLYLERRLAERGLMPCHVAPPQLRWVGGRALAATEDRGGPLDLVVRFFPTEWLPQLPTTTGWRSFLDAGRTPCCNPGYALLTQSKRFPLVWDRLRTPLPTWRSLLPETRPASLPLPAPVEDWVIKPVLGHEGRDIVMSGVTGPADSARILRAAGKDPARWIAQRRFQTLPVDTPEGPMYPCLGIYVIDGRAAGAYGRISAGPLINGSCREIVVLVRHRSPGGEGRSDAARSGV